MKVLPLGDHVVDALQPSAIARLEAGVRDDLRVVLTFVRYAENLAQLMTSRGAKLTRVTSSDMSDFYFGTTAAGTLLRPIDDRGTQLAVDGTRTGLSTVTAVAILAVGLSLREATNR